MSHPLESWKLFLSVEDYLVLIHFVENIKHNIVNDQMILLYGTGPKGKTDLIRDITQYIGEDTCSPIYNMWSTVYDSHAVQLFIMEAFNVKDDYDDELEKIIDSGKSIISTTDQDPYLALLDDTNLAAHVHVIIMKPSNQL